MKAVHKLNILINVDQRCFTAIKPENTELLNLNPLGVW